LIQRASVLAGLDVTFEKPLKGAFVAKNALQSAGALAFLGANSDALANLSVENGIILAVMLIKVALVALNATPFRLEAARHGNSSKRVLAVASDFVSKSAMCTVRVLDNTDVTFLSTPG
jgi:energy-converting hydrogenase Eha subunit H